MRHTYLVYTFVYVRCQWNVSCMLIYMYMDVFVYKCTTNLLSNAQKLRLRYTWVYIFVNMFVLTCIKMYLCLHTNILSMWIANETLLELPAYLLSFLFSTLWVLSLLFLWQCKTGLSYILIFMLSSCAYNEYAMNTIHTYIICKC